MQAPRRVWPDAPWSPLGYRVVEIADETGPMNEATPQASRPPDPPPPEGDWPFDVPWSPSDYVPIEIRPEQPAEMPPPAEDVPRRPRRRGFRRLAFCGAVLLGCSFLFAGGVSVVLASLPRSALPMPPRVTLVAHPTPPTGQHPAVPGCAPGGCQDANQEGFGTAVTFVRNPEEAARLATQERKLTFILHVSGNFEDPGFT